MHPVCKQYFTNKRKENIFSLILQKTAFVCVITNVVNTRDGLSMIMWITPYQTEHL